MLNYFHLVLIAGANFDSHLGTWIDKMFVKSYMIVSAVQKKIVINQ